MEKSYELSGQWLRILKEESRDDEQWTHLPGYEDRYLISDQFRVFSLTTGKVMVQYEGEDGKYIYVCHHGNKRRFLVKELWDATWKIILFGSPLCSNDWIVYTKY